MRVLRTVLGVVIGYALMVVLITLVQEVWFGGVGFHDSSLLELALAGVLTFVCAMAGGATATIVAGTSARNPGFAMSIIVVIETTALVITGRLGGPLWFDLAASASLIVGILLGAELVLRGGMKRAATVT